MAYSQAIVQRAMQRLQSENEQNEQSSRARIAAIYEKQPRLGESIGSCAGPPRTCSPRRSAGRATPWPPCSS